MVNDIRIWMFGLVGVALVGNMGDINASRQVGQQVRAHEQAATETRRLQKSEARELQKQSEVAMERIKAGCVPVIANRPLITAEGQFNQELRLTEGMVADNGAGDPLTNTVICTSAGDTAIAVDGQVTQVVRAAPTAMAEYQSLFNQLPTSGQMSTVHVF